MKKAVFLLDQIPVDFQLRQYIIRLTRLTTKVPDVWRHRGQSLCQSKLTRLSYCR